VAELLRALADHGKPLTRAELENIVATKSQRRRNVAGPVAAVFDPGACRERGLRSSGPPPNVEKLASDWVVVAWSFRKL
jgi:hypothetical protein